MNPTTGDERAQPAQPQLFARKASGFVRDVGIKETIGISAGISCPIYLFIAFAAGLSLYPDGDYTIGILVMVVMWLLVILGYRALLTAAPRAGGEYVYASRFLTPGIGAMVGLGMAISFMWQLAFAARAVAAAALPTFFAALGSALGSQSITNAGNDVSSPNGLLITSLVVIGLCGLLAFFPLRSIGRLLLWFVVIQVLGLIVADVIFLSHPHSAFVGAFNAASGSPHAYSHLLAAAKHSTGIPGTSVSGVLGAIPYLFVGMAGVQWGYYAGGELKRPSRTYLTGTLTVLAVAAAFYLITWLLMKHSAGMDFMRAQALVSGNEPSTYGHITSVSATAGGLAYAVFLSGDPVTKLILGSSMLLGLLGIAMVYFAVTTRNLFALAFDGLVPKQLARVDDRRHTPVVASAVLIAAAVGFAVLLRYTSLAQALTDATLVGAAIVVIGMICAAVLPVRRTKLAGENSSGPRRLSTIGLVGAAMVLAIVVVIVANPARYGQFNTASLITLAVLVVAGPVLYVYRRTLGKRRRSIDVSLAMRELPPE